ncbi:MULTISPECIES: NAD(P)-dependent oxidoreductase [Flavobacteriaceae]|uniref:Putative NADH-flavin reductase n=1 Tax=Galbibacter orientalis DSM 19592 TaxID=926559 RepID=I3C1U9_9FLAO|nr:NAD(P)H-binding protein [Galbibacter orientalis]EIJ37592.1 putative NADH-flavin reductase [Galbibacter orientalis DSM 19592]|tara:strand:- start:1283 stop:1930 length:648 start_codon:yes stop_codon:yes gene_type:complete
MKIVIIGATGFLGSKLVNEARNRDFEITAIARNTDTIIDKKVNKISVDVNNVEKLTEALKGQDVVISAFNAGWTNPNIYEDFIAGSKSIQEAVKKASAQRLIVIGGAGSLYTTEKQQIVDMVDFPKEIKPGATAARDYLNILKEEKDIDWAFFSPAIDMHPGITTGRTGQYRLGKDNPVFDQNNVSSLSGEDVAVVILDEVESPKHHQERFTAAY